MSEKTCPNCGYPKDVHQMFSPPRCPVIRLKFPPDGGMVTFSRGVVDKSWREI